MPSQAALDREGTLATDDLQAREHATDRDIPLTGSVGLLVRFVIIDDLTAADADTILHQWITTYHYQSPVESVHDVLDTE